MQRAPHPTTRGDHWADNSIRKAAHHMIHVDWDLEQSRAAFSSQALLPSWRSRGGSVAHEAADQLPDSQNMKPRDLRKLRPEEAGR